MKETNGNIKNHKHNWSSNEVRLLVWAINKICKGNHKNVKQLNQKDWK